jgi:hypothetical protein
MLAACGGVRMPQCGSPFESSAKDAKLQPSRAAKAKPDPKALAARAKRPPAFVSPTSEWRSLSIFLPDKLDGYRARVVTQGADMNLVGDVSLRTARRAYAKDDVWLELEVIDTARCERVRALFKRSRELARESPVAVFRPMKVEGHLAFSQWSLATRTARTSVLVADRFLVNANVKPADSVAASIGLTQKLAWDALQKLAAEPPPLPRTAADATAGADAMSSNGAPDEPAAPSNADADMSLLAAQPP